MQLYPRSPDPAWPSHLHGTVCVGAWAMDTGSPTVVWRLFFGSGFHSDPAIPDRGLECVCLGTRFGFAPPLLGVVRGACVSGSVQR